MSGALHQFFSEAFFMPHGHCYLWKPELVWTHVISDTLIGVAYASIATSLYMLVRKVRLPFTPMFWAFGVFIGFCGGTHLVEVWNVWQANYWFSAAVKVITAGASIATAVLLYPVAPKVIAIARAAELSEDRRMKLEAAHAELQALYERNRSLDAAKTNFFANVSHELRTPLALITGHVEALREAAGDKAGDRLDAIGRNARLLLKHVNDLLDGAKLDAKRMGLRYTDFDVASTLSRTVALFADAARERGISLELEARGPLPLQADEEKVERMLLNLLSNALRFTPSGGRIRCMLSARDGSAVIEVADSGPGVPPELQETIFERFAQGEPSLTRRFGGTGLGLAIVKDFVELHGGHVTVGRAPEGGALFTLQLPLGAPDGVPSRSLSHFRRKLGSSRSCNSRATVSAMLTSRAPPCSRGQTCWWSKTTRRWRRSWRSRWSRISRWRRPRTGRRASHARRRCSPT